MTRGEDAVAKSRVEPGTGTSDPGDETATPKLLRRVLELESEVRTLRDLVEVRDESLRVLTGRLLRVEQQAQLAECDQLRRERDEAVATAELFQQMKIFRYTRWPRAAYGALLRLRRMLA
jgi:hypothetical protein